MSVPLTVKVLGSLLVILAANMALRRLVIALALGVVLLGLWCGHPMGSLLPIVGTKTLSVDNLLLLVAVFQVITLSLQMKATGVMDDMVTSVQSRLSRRLSIAAMPAIIGLLPMPGGALFSAPLVDSCDADGVIRPIEKFTINYWFRHLWEYWWPLYPGFILAVALAKIEIWQFMLVQLPFSLVSAAVGYWFFLRNIPGDEEPTDSPSAPESGKHLLFLFSPILVTILIYTLITVGWAITRQRCPDLPGIQKYIPMIVGLLAASGLLQMKRPLKASDWKTILFSPRTAAILVLVVMVRAYGALIESTLPDGTPLVGAMQQELVMWNISLVPVMIIIPLIAGLSTGLSVGFVGASFPIIMNLIGPDPALNIHLATAMLTYCSGFIGMMLSPIHVCLVVTNEHFKTRLIHSLWHLLIPLSTVLFAVLVWYFVLIR